ncbi:MAG: hypothetical protein AAB320_05535 [Elusimicrobiota bacterium]
MKNPLPRLLLLAVFAAAALPLQAAETKPAAPAAGLNDFEMTLQTAVRATGGAAWEEGKKCDATIKDAAKNADCWRPILARFAQNYVKTPESAEPPTENNPNRLSKTTYVFATRAVGTEAVKAKGFDVAKVEAEIKKQMASYAKTAPAATTPPPSKLPTDVKAITQANDCAKSAEECAKVIQGSTDNPPVVAGKLKPGATDTGKTASEVVDPNASKGKDKAEPPKIGALTASPKKPVDVNAANDTISGAKGAIYGGLLGLMFGGPIGMLLFAAIGFGATYMISKQVNS